MEVFIDGACKNNGKPAAKASYGIFWGQNDIKNIYGIIPNSYKQTNNTGELYSAIKCLQQIHDLKISNITIKTDSEYLVRGITNDIIHWKNSNWKLKSTGKDVKNKELWIEIDNLSTDINVTWIHIARDSEYGQVEADKLAKLALTSKSHESISVNKQGVASDCSDDESETVPMKIFTPRIRPNTSAIFTKARKSNTKTTSPSFSMMSTLRRIESLVLSTAEEVSTLNDNLNCHIDSTNRRFDEINDKFVSLSTTVKVQTDSAISSVEDVLTETQIIKANIEINNKAFVDKSTSLWDKVNTLSQEFKSFKSAVTNNPKREVGDQIDVKEQQQQHFTINKTRVDSTPGTYSNAVKQGSRPVSQLNTHTRNEQQRQNSPTFEFNSRRSERYVSTPNRIGKSDKWNNSKQMDREMNIERTPFRPVTETKKLFLIGSSTLRKMSARKMSSDELTTKVKTISGGRIRDIEDCLFSYISSGSLDGVDVIAVHTGTNNVSDGDSVNAILHDYQNLIETVKQGLPRTKIMLSSILPRPTNPYANKVISEVNNSLFRLEDDRVCVLDNTLDFLYGNRPNRTLYRDHVHTNNTGTIVLSNNILTAVHKMFGLQDEIRSQEPTINFQSARTTGRRHVQPVNMNNRFHVLQREFDWK